MSRAISDAEGSCMWRCFSDAKGHLICGRGSSSAKECHSKCREAVNCVLGQLHSRSRRQGVLYFDSPFKRSPTFSLDGTLSRRWVSRSISGRSGNCESMQYLDDEASIVVFEVDTAREVQDRVRRQQPKVCSPQLVVKVCSPQGKGLDPQACPLQGWGPQGRPPLLPTG